MELDCLRSAYFSTTNACEIAYKNTVIVENELC